MIVDIKLYVTFSYIYIYIYYIFFILLSYMIVLNRENNVRKYFFNIKNIIYI